MGNILDDLTDALNEGEKAAKEVFRLWQGLGSRVPLPPYFMEMEIDGEWGSVELPHSELMPEMWLRWQPEHLAKCSYGIDQCLECQEAETRKRYLTVEEFLGGFAGYLATQLAITKETITRRNNLARGLRTALANVQCDE